MSKPTMIIACQHCKRPYAVKETTPDQNGTTSHGNCSLCCVSCGSQDKTPERPYCEPCATKWGFPNPARTNAQVLAKLPDDTISRSGGGDTGQSLASSPSYSLRRCNLCQYEGTKKEVRLGRCVRVKECDERWRMGEKRHDLTHYAERHERGISIDGSKG